MKLRIAFPPMFPGWEDMPLWWERADRSRPLPSRTVEIIVLRLQGWKFDDIGDVWGITRLRARDIYYHALAEFWAQMEKENRYFERQQSAANGDGVSQCSSQSLRRGSVPGE